MPLNTDFQKGSAEKGFPISKKYAPIVVNKVSSLALRLTPSKKIQQFCIGKMKEQGMPKFVAWLFTRSIVDLEGRWSKTLFAHIFVDRGSHTVLQE